MNPTDPNQGGMPTDPNQGQAPVADPNTGQTVPEMPVAEAPAPEAPVAETPAPEGGEVNPGMGGDQGPASPDASQSGQNPTGGAPVV